MGNSHRQTEKGCFCSSPFLLVWFVFCWTRSFECCLRLSWVNGPEMSFSLILSFHSLSCLGACQLWSERLPSSFCGCGGFLWVWTSSPASKLGLMKWSCLCRLSSEPISLCAGRQDAQTFGYVPPLFGPFRRTFGTFWSFLLSCCNIFTFYL